MADLRGTYSTQIALVLQRAKDRDINLTDLDPSRRNTRNVTLMAVERMKLPLLTTRTTVDVLGTPIKEDLAGAKPGTSFTSSQIPSAILALVHAGRDLYETTGVPAAGQFSRSGITYTMGLTVQAGDELWIQYIV